MLGVRISSDCPQILASVSRLLDYAVASSHLVPVSRRQESYTFGLSDHFMVQYSLDVTEPANWAGPRRLVDIADQDFVAVCQFGFLLEHAIGLMTLGPYSPTWLNSCLLQTLAADSSEIGYMGHHAAQEDEPVAAVRFRGLLRRIDHAVRHPGQASLFRRIAQDCKSLVVHCPGLDTCAQDLGQACVLADKALRALLLQARDQRLRLWKQQLEKDEAKARRWVKARAQRQLCERNRHFPPHRASTQVA